MEICDDKNGVKDRILDDLGKSIKLIQRYALCGYEGVVVIGNDSWLVQSLCHLLDLVVQHGLRDHHRGYWPIVREFSHSDTLQIIQNLKSINTSLGKGRAWLYYTLTEGSLQSYLQCMCRDVKVLHRNYMRHALLRDTSRTQQLITLLAGLEQVQFNLDPDVAYLDMAAYQQQHSEVSSDLLPSCGDPSNLGARMTSSITSSLASPVDSGVALLDSDADATSVSEATINETDNLSLRDDKEDDSTFNEIEDNRINHQLLSLEVTVGKNLSEISGVDIKPDKISEVNPDTSPQSEVIPKVEVLRQLHHEGAFGCDYSSSAKEEILSTSEELSGVAGVIAATPSVVVSPQAEIVSMSDAFRSRSFSIMTASDIANQNISEDIATPAGTVGNEQSDSFVETKNKVNKKLSILEDSKGHRNSSHIESVKTDCDIIDKINKSKVPSDKTSDNDDIVYRRQRSKKKRNSGSNTSSAVDNATKVKRVSFHEDIISNESDHSKMCPPSGGTEFSVSFLPPDSVIKRDAVKGRYSWCGEGDAPFVRRKNNEADTKSDVYLSSSTSNSSSNETVCVDNQRTQMSCTDNIKCSQTIYEKERHVSLELPHMPPVAERGTPEGQEDPPNSASNLSLYTDRNHKQGIGRSLPEAIRRLSGSLKKLPSFSYSTEWLSDTESIPASDTEFVCSRTGHLIASSFKENDFLDNLMGSSSLTDVRPSKSRYQHRNSRKSSPLGLLPSRDVASKTSLLNRFMRSLTEKKFVKKKPKLLLKPNKSLYIPGVKKVNREEILEQFKFEIGTEIRPSVSDTAACFGSEELQEILKSQVFQDSKEIIYKVYRVSNSYSSDGIARPLLALLTNVNLYLTGVKSNFSYCNHLVLPYTELDAILVGPNYQTVLLVNANRETQFLVMTGNRKITEDMVAHMEIAMRRAPTKPSLPAVRILDLEDMKALRHSLAKDIPVLEDEAICHYSIVHLQDEHVSPPTTPMGPTKEGHLMFRPATETPLQPWEPGFFMLKAGVVYMFGEKSHRLPKRVIPLRENGCRGCRRIPNAQRPHTFEILLGPRKSFQFAAADEYEASDWLQAFVQAASGVYDEEQVKAVSCSLVVTEQHLVTCQENFPSLTSSGSGCVRILSCAAIRDLTSFTVDSNEHSWCVLEFACREVHENSGDWVLYFSSSDEMYNFKCVLQKLWLSLQQTDFPLCPLVDDSLGRRCGETSSLLTGAWNVLLPLASQASL